MELLPPCSTHIEITAKGLEGKSHHIVVNPLPVHSLRSMAIIDSREIDALSVFVSRHELHLAKARIKRAGRTSITFNITNGTIRIATELEACYLAAIPIGPIELSVGRNAHLRAVEPFEQHSGGDVFDRGFEAELAVRGGY